MRILVTGGAGFIGSHLVDELLRQGHEVMGLDDLSAGSLANVEHHRGQKGFYFLQGSILSPRWVEEALRGCQLVYHLAAVVGVKRVVEDPLACLITNVRGTEVVLEAAYNNGCKVVLASSSEVYGKSASLPLAEGDDAVLGPTTVARWAYAVAKTVDEHLALAYARKGLPVVVLRYFNSYGPRLNPQGYASVVGRFVSQALRGEPITVHGNGAQTRAFTYIEDTVRGTVMAAETQEAEGHVLNIGSSTETSILELAQLVLAVTGSASAITFVPHAEVYGSDFEDPRRRLPATGKAEQLLGFRATIPLEEGLRRTAGWMAKEIGQGSIEGDG